MLASFQYITDLVLQTNTNAHEQALEYITVTVTSCSRLHHYKHVLLYKHSSLKAERSYHNITIT